MYNIICVSVNFFDEDSEEGLNKGIWRNAEIHFAASTTDY